MPILPALSEFTAIEAKVIEAGVDDVMAMWEKLGLTFTEIPPDSLAIHVFEPCRDNPNG